MKKAILLITLCLTVFSTMNAQSFSEKAAMYDTHQYVSGFSDPYDPALAGIASFFIPGLGQMICDEAPRGLAFLGGSIGCFALTCYGYVELFSSTVEEMMEGDSFINLKGGGKVALGTAGMLGIGIWSIFDAIHVAKVNNMYFQDNRKTGSVNFEIAPYVEPISLCNQVTVPVGLTLKATF